MVKMDLWLNEDLKIEAGLIHNHDPKEFISITTVSFDYTSDEISSLHIDSDNPIFGSSDAYLSVQIPLLDILF